MITAYFTNVNSFMISYSEPLDLVGLYIYTPSETTVFSNFEGQKNF